jgi:hypothetical protein
MGIRARTRTGVIAVALATILPMNAAFSGENESVEFALVTPSVYQNVGPGETIEVSIDASGMVEAKQVEIVIDLSPPEAFDLESSSFDSGASPFTLAPGLDLIGGGRVRGGGASVAVAVNGDGALGTFRIQTSEQFSDRSEATLEVILISIGPSFDVRDEFGAADLGLSIEINPGVASIGEPSLVATSPLDVSADPSPTGTGTVMDGSRGEVTFAAVFKDSTETATEGQTVSWSITNKGDAPVFLIGNEGAEIPPSSTRTAMSISDIEGRVSITLDSEGRSSGAVEDGSVTPTRVVAIASTAAPNSVGVSRDLKTEFSAAWDLSVPAELASFTANVESGLVRLLWSAASQSANLGWQVHRSLEGGPSTQLGDLVTGAGTTDEFLSYSYLDTELPADATRVSYYLKQLDLDGSGVRSRALEITVAPAELALLAPAYRLEQNWPNPFNPETAIHFELPTESAVTLTIYDATGQTVKRIIRGLNMAPGRHNAVWDGSDDAGHQVGSGTYFYGLRAGLFHSVARMTLLR